MATEILKSFGTLQTELENAKNTLKGVDENIKRLIGRDPSELYTRNTVNKRSLSGPTNNDDTQSPQMGRLNNRSRPMGLNRRIFSHENDEPSTKRRPPGSVFRRLSDKPVIEDLEPEPVVNTRQMISKVIVTPREIPSRQQALAAQGNDEKFRARNRRMFGALLGTLQKFQQEETKLKSKEDKRALLEKKIEENEIQEKAEIKKERQELFFNRKKKQAEIKMIELKMTRMREYNLWEEQEKPRMYFIHTKAKPHIHYMPKKMNDVNKIALVESRNEVEKQIDTRRQEVFDELKRIEDRMKRNFEPRKWKNNTKKDKEEGEITEENGNADPDADIEANNESDDDVAATAAATTVEAPSKEDNEKENTVQEVVSKPEENDIIASNVSEESTVKKEEMEVT